MQQPDEEFIETVVILAREEEKQLKHKENNNNNNNNNNKSSSKQQYKKYIIDKPEQVVSWLLYLIVNGTYPTIKDKAIQLLSRHLTKEGKHLIRVLSKEVLEALKVETIELLKTTTNLTDTFGRHLFRIIESLAIYLLPRCSWNELDIIINGKEGEGLKDNERGLIKVLSKYDNFKKEKQEMLVKMINKFDFFKRQSDDQYRSYIPILLSMLVQIDLDTQKVFFDNLLRNLTSILIRDYPDPAMHQLIQQIIDTMIQLFFKGDHATKSIMFPNFFQIASRSPNKFTDHHLERIISCMYEWLSNVKDIELEEWTDSSSKIEHYHDLIPRNPTRDIDYHLDNRLLDVISHFGRFLRVLGQDHRAQVHIFNQLNVLLNSQQHSWKQRYSALISLSKFYDSINPDILTQQFPIIFKLVLKLVVNDENIRVRWASLQCLIQFTKEFKELMIESSDEIFQAIVGKPMNDPNESIQTRCCILIKAMIDMDVIVDDNVKEGLYRLFERLFQSPKLVIVENALLSFISVLKTGSKIFIHYSGNIVGILLNLFEKHYKSRILSSRLIKAFSLCSYIMRETTFSKDLNKFMQFVRKNEKSIDLIDVFRASSLFMQMAGKSFAVYLPMLIRMAIKILETPLPQWGITEESSLNIERITKTLDSLNDGIMFESYYIDYIPLAPFVHGLAVALCYLVQCRISAEIRNRSFDSLPTCVKLSKLHFGARSDKTLGLFGMSLNTVLLLCPVEPCLFVISSALDIATTLIRVMGKEAMTLDQTRLVLDTFTKVEKRMYYIAEQVRGGNEEIVADDEDIADVPTLTVEALSSGYEMIGMLLKQNSVMAAPLITSDLLVKSCQKLRDNQEEQGDQDDNDDDEEEGIGQEEEERRIINEGILSFLVRYCEYGGEDAINTFPQIIPTIIKCLTLTGVMEQNSASYALGVAAQITKDRFSPWVMQVLQAFDIITYAPNAYVEDKKDVTETVIVSVGRIIRNVPQVASHVCTIIPKWLNHLPLTHKDSFLATFQPLSEEKEISLVIDNLCTIIRLYPNQCFGKEYQHVAKIHQIIQNYLARCQRFEKIILIRAWLFIKDSIQSNWDIIPLDTKDQLSNLKELARE
ncbi:hypothetical protein DFA_00467 [Cavenderia fasciculata]|uniref:Uncharacterized protein n=1 Tax=Cavenderia fasciculata TaxID=261658 RepID=F4PS08_CACFS|nr:uncharacterized protein DFA_00467 [Cavenderia fasciculata]EGG20606.1 hypothetical protein DFA_00467 [Cavenderia fasciculata]|eukprot:XP_004358456.1 hypothetical protein DFA_00467 [Cavenderia fasciculata]